MTRSRTKVLVLGVLALAVATVAAPTIVGAVERGGPNLDVYLEDDELEPGTTDSLEFQLQNDAELIVGTGDHVMTARGVSIELEDTGPFEAKSGRTAVGHIPDGQVVDAPQRLEVPESVEPGEYEITVRVRYSYFDFVSEDSGSTERHTASERFDVTVVVPEEPRFDVTDLESTLAVGYDGEVTGTITNDGTEGVDDPVLTVEPRSGSLFVEDAQYALPELEPNASAEFRYPIDVSGQADPGPRQLQFTVEYTDEKTFVESDPITERVVVDDTHEEFSIETVSADVRQGETNEVVLEITNERPETLSNVDAMLYTDDPLAAPNDEAFVHELESGESAEIRFELAAAPDAAVETHPVELDFEYDTERGDTVVSDVYQHPIDVEPGQKDDDGGNLGMIAAVMALLTAAGLGAGFWWRNA